MAKSDHADWVEVRGEIEEPGCKPIFDDMVATGPIDSIHLEMLNDTQLWIGIYKGDERQVVLVESKNRRSHVVARTEQDA